MGCGPNYMTKNNRQMSFCIMLVPCISVCLISVYLSCAAPSRIIRRRASRFRTFKPAYSVWKFSARKSVSIRKACWAYFRENSGNFQADAYIFWELCITPKIWFLFAVCRNNYLHSESGINWAISDLRLGSVWFCKHHKLFWCPFRQGSEWRLNTYT